jgi:hypothetical protein
VGEKKMIKQKWTCQGHTPSHYVEGAKAFQIPPHKTMFGWPNDPTRTNIFVIIFN